MGSVWSLSIKESVRLYTDTKIVDSVSIDFSETLDTRLHPLTGTCSGPAVKRHVHRQVFIPIACRADCV